MARSKILERMMAEVHRKTPSTVPKRMKGAAKERMLRAIAFSKARKAGARV